jgi:hypothetical protein
MAYPTDVWAVLPVKETANAKQRLAGVLSAELRRQERAMAIPVRSSLLPACSHWKGEALFFRSQAIFR